LGCRLFAHRMQLGMINQATLVTRTKSQYSELEAAQELGVSVEQLRTLIRSHIAQSDEDLNHVSTASFHPSDLLVLKILSGLSARSTVQDSAE
jgi:hypothetical protein